MSATLIGSTAAAAFLIYAAVHRLTQRDTPEPDASPEPVRAVPVMPQWAGVVFEWVEFVESWPAWDESDQLWDPVAED